MQEIFIKNREKFVFVAFCVTAGKSLARRDFLKILNHNGAKRHSLPALAVPKGGRRSRKQISPKRHGSENGGLTRRRLFK